MTLLQTLLADIRRLPPIPAVINQLLAVVDTPGVSMEEIARIIQYDPIITANVLKTCNSAYFGLKHPAESIRDAVNLLGTDKVIELALVKSGASALTGSQAGYGLGKGEIWRYSVISAVAAKEVAGRMGLDNKNTIFTCALLKDIGKIILEKYVLDAKDKIQALIETGSSFREAEKTVLGIDHGELGAMIIKMWKFSPRMVNIIRNHHLPDESMIENREITAVYLADCICMMMGDGVGADGLSYRFRDQAMRAHGISADDLDMIISDMGMHLDEVNNLLQNT